MKKDRLDSERIEVTLVQGILREGKETFLLDKEEVVCLSHF